MAEQKTRPSAASVQAFLERVEPPQRREDARAVCAMMQRLSGESPVLWGPSMVGFGRYHYRYDSGHEGDAFLVGFSPRKAALVVYIMSGFAGHDGLMKRLGKHKTGKSCLYINKLADVDGAVLEQLVAGSLAYMRAKDPSRPSSW